MVLREARKVKHLFSKSIYSDLFNKLNTANNILKTLADLSIDPRQPTQGSLQSVLRHRKARMVANSVHRALACGKCWGCLCQDKHHVRYILDPKCGPNDESCRLVIATAVADDPAETLCSWQEMEVESSNLAKPVPASVAAQKRKAELAVPSFERRLCTEPNHAVLPTPAPNLCSTLSALEMTEGRRELVAFLQDKKYHHYMYIARKDLEVYSRKLWRKSSRHRHYFPGLLPGKADLYLTDETVSTSQSNLHAAFSSSMEAGSVQTGAAAILCFPEGLRSLKNRFANRSCCGMSQNPRNGWPAVRSHQSFEMRLSFLWD